MNISSSAPKFRVLLIPKMCLKLYAERINFLRLYAESINSATAVRHIICCDTESGIHFYACVE